MSLYVRKGINNTIQEREGEGEGEGKGEGEGEGEVRRRERGNESLTINTYF